MSEEEDIVSEVLSASIGGAISASMLYPLEVLKTKMQAETTSSKKTDANDEGNAENEGDEEDDDDDDLTKLNMVDYARHLYKTQGLKVFFSGFETSAFQSASEKALYFFAYTSLKNLYRTLLGDGSTPTSIVSLLLGCCAEWAHLPLTLPLDCWTTAIQTNRDSTKGPMQLLLNLLSEKVRKFTKFISD
jgi:solute carrier family 25 (peroxisomal adenine nucleotide transporter), member 17